VSAEAPDERATNPLLIVLSGPSGVGKDAVLARMRQERKPYHFVVTATTRPIRPSECDGRDYIFVEEPAFREMIQAGDLLEWAEVYGNLYGVPRSQIVDEMSRGRDVIVKPDVQGAATIREQAPDALFIFLAPPTMQEMERRLRQRMTESPEALQRRLDTARQEMQEASKFDYVVVNHDGRMDDAVAEIEAIIDGERHRTPPRRVALR
jgi:guanylate kinase